MVKYLVYTSDTRVFDVDYLYEKEDKFLSVLPYLKRKIEGDWKIAILEPDIKFVRRTFDEQLVPEYVELALYMERSIAERIMIEKPQLAVKEKTAFEKYMDSISEMKILIRPDAAKELYRRVGTNKAKLPEYLLNLSQLSKGEITVADVRREVADERTLYASDVVNSFLLHERWRWTRYEKFVKMLGRDYAYYAIRKYITKLLNEKNAYLRNEETSIRVIDKIDSVSVCAAFTIFNTTRPEELDICMQMLDRNELRRVLYDSAE